MQLNRVRMRHLRCFMAVVQTGSVTKAAERIGTVQPSVSRSIRELEEELGRELFDRSGAGLSLNDSGRTFYAYVSTGLGQVDRAYDAVRGQSAEARVTAYILPNVVRVVMPGAVRRFKQLSPNVDLTFIPTMSGGQRELLRQGKIDFGFGRMQATEDMEGLNFEHLFSEPLVFFVREGHPLADRKALTFADLDAYEVVIPNAGTIIRAELDRFIISCGATRFNNVVETLSFEFARTYLTISDAVVFQPLGAMRRELDSGTVVRLDFAQGALNGVVGLTFPAGRRISASAELMMQSIREELAALGLRGGQDISELL